MTAGTAVLIRCQARQRYSIDFSCPEQEISFSSGNAVIPHTCGSMFLRCFFKFFCNSFIEIQITVYLDNRKYNRYEKIRLRQGCFSPEGLSGCRFSGGAPAGSDIECVR